MRNLEKFQAKRYKTDWKNVKLVQPLQCACNNEYVYFELEKQTKFSVKLYFLNCKTIAKHAEKCALGQKKIVVLA